MNSISDNPAILAVSQLLLLVFLRILPLVTLSPLFGGAVVPRRMRTGLAAVLALVIVFPLSSALHAPVPLIELALLMAKELLIGLIFAVLVTIVFDLFASMGALIDLARGSTLSSVFDPMRGNRDSALAVFMPLLALTIFLTLGGYRYILTALAASFGLVGPNDALPPGMLGPQGMLRFVQFSSAMFTISIRLAAPVIALLLLVDVAMALINRYAPQIEVFFLASESKGWLGILMLLFSLEAAATLMPGIFRAMLQEIQSILRL
jgi:flagellar biosynthetic protein FliR